MSLHDNIMVSVAVFHLTVVVVESEEDTYTGYGTWHFVSIFIVAVVVAIACYFGLLHRKKVRLFVLQTEHIHRYMYMCMYMYMYRNS